MKVSFKSITPIIVPDRLEAQLLQQELERAVPSTQYKILESDQFETLGQKPSPYRLALNKGKEVLFFLTGIDLIKHQENINGFKKEEQILKHINRDNIVLKSDEDLKDVVDTLAQRVDNEIEETEEYLTDGIKEDLVYTPLEQLIKETNGLL